MPVSVLPSELPCASEAAAPRVGGVLVLSTPQSCQFSLSGQFSCRERVIFCFETVFLVFLYKVSVSLLVEKV